MIINKKLFIILFTFFLVNISVLQCIKVDGLSVEQTGFCELCADCKNYIIRFKDEPLSLYLSKLQETYPDNSDGPIRQFIKTKLQDHKNKLTSYHNYVKNKIIEFLGTNTNSKNLIKNEFFKVFNGIVIGNVYPEIIDKIRLLPMVESVNPSGIVKVDLDESVPLIRADLVHNLHDSYGYPITGKDVTVALIDSGVDYTHPDLVDNILVNPGEDLNHNGVYDQFDENNIDDDGNGLVDDIIGWSFNKCAHYIKIDETTYECDQTKSEDNNISDGANHGTRCAGIITAVAPDAKIYPLKVVNYQGIGDSIWILDALERAHDPNNDGDFSDSVDIVSMSLGSLLPVNPDEDDLCIAVDNLVSSGVTVVASAGNRGVNGSYNITSPGSARKSICVGASNKQDKIAGFSSRGPVITNSGEIIKPDVVAPGVSILTTSANGGYISGQGTSFSAPHVSGAVALLLQAHPQWTPDDVKLAIKETAIDIGEDENTQGAGRIDVLNAYYYPNLPVAILDVPESLEQGIIDIKGTVKSGTGNPTDLVSYSLYYKKDSSWNKIYEGYEEVNNGILMENWNVTSLNTGPSKLKLIVKTVNQTSSEDIKTINIIGTIKIILDAGKIIGPSGDIYENTSFVLNIYNSDYEPIRAFALLFAPFSIPQIKYGSRIVLKAPRILNPFSSEKQGKLIIIKLVGRKKIQHTLTFINNIGGLV